jgi:hypothetical protein
MCWMWIASKMSYTAGRRSDGCWRKLDLSGDLKRGVVVGDGVELLVRVDDCEAGGDGSNGARCRGF